jgi:HPt (histidine-containing phosphotransfer) domain-containing protein
MSRNQVAQQAIYSKLAGDPVLGELIAQFVAELPSRAIRLRRQLADQDWTALMRTAHQLKGAAGSYGFDAITPVASKLELQINHGVEPKVVTETVQELISLCQRATAGIPLAAR